MKNKNMESEDDPIEAFLSDSECSNSYKSPTSEETEEVSLRVWKNVESYASCLDVVEEVLGGGARGKIHQNLPNYVPVEIEEILIRKKHRKTKKQIETKGLVLKMDDNFKRLGPRELLEKGYKMERHIMVGNTKRRNNNKTTRIKHDPVNLTLLEIEYITQLPCWICQRYANEHFRPVNAVAPIMSFSGSSHKLSVVWKIGRFDRIDNDKGYHPDNVLPICQICNRARGDMDIETTIAYFYSIINVHSEHPDQTFEQFRQSMLSRTIPPLTTTKIDFPTLEPLLDSIQ